jgi:anti-anti-sigma factor
MDVQEQERGRVLVLRGRLDPRAAPDVRQSLHRVVDTGSGQVQVEVSGLVLVDVASLGLLLEAHRRAERAGRHLVLVGVPPPLERMLRVTRLDRVLDQRDHLDGTPLPEAATA